MDAGLHMKSIFPISIQGQQLSAGSFHDIDIGEVEDFYPSARRFPQQPVVAEATYPLQSRQTMRL